MVFSISMTLFFFFLSFRGHAADPYYDFHVCENTTTFVANCTYHRNLKTLLSSLSNASRPNGAYTGFHNTTIGRDPDDVYGLFLCRGDLSASACQDCVNFATGDVSRRCPVEKEAIIWYEECHLRYSNAPFVENDSPHQRVQNGQSSADPDKLNNELGTLMTQLTTTAVNSSRRFATGVTNNSEFQKLYGLVQCTQDLSSTDCNLCLGRAIAILPSCCSGAIGARLLYPSCVVRYNLYPFFNVSSITAPPPLLLSTPPTVPTGRIRRIPSSTIIAIVVPVAFAVVLLTAYCCIISRRAKKKYKYILDKNAGDDMTTVESLQFDFGTIEAATNQFSTENKLGEGGFGEVYKGTLPNGQEVAVKRLSRSSGQGVEEFKSEVVLVAKLQHRNLVRLLGFCLQGGEKILVYEFMTNKSLDYFLFDPEKQGQVNWSRRYKIIEGIARGLLYLHEDSRLRIIHRDLKASNVLLDADMNSKISDFGMARIFGVDQTRGSTSRVVGTLGYMAPEYATRGHFSVKSDVYSFGVLVLEIISGKKINNFYETDDALDLLSYAWKHWRAGTPLELLDPTLTKDSFSRNEVIRCVQVGLLCVQEEPAARPTMKTILLTLSSHSFTIPAPGDPAFSSGNRKSIPLSVDEASITEVHPR